MIRLGLDDNGLILRLKAVEEGAVLNKVKTYLKGRADREVAIMRQRVSRRYVPGRKSKDLQSRSGALAAAIASKVSTGSGAIGARGITVEIGVIKGNAKVKQYALVQELGTVGAGGVLPDIKPKKSKLLMIPVGPALTATGEAAFKPKQADQRYDAVYFVRGKGAAAGRVFMYGRRGDSSELIFVGVKRVAIPPRPIVKPSAETMVNDIRPVLQRILRNAVGG